MPSDVVEYRTYERTSPRDESVHSQGNYVSIAERDVYTQLQMQQQPVKSDAAHPPLPPRSQGNAIYLDIEQ